MDCQTELRISTVTYFSTSRAPQSSGPFLPFPLPFLPMIRLRGPRWTARGPDGLRRWRKTSTDQTPQKRRSGRLVPQTAKVGTRWTPLTKSQPRTGHHCTRRCVVGAAQRTVAVKRHRATGVEPAQPGDTRDARTHTDHTDERHKIITIQPHTSAAMRRSSVSRRAMASKRRARDGSLRDLETM